MPVWQGRVGLCQVGVSTPPRLLGRALAPELRPSPEVCGHWQGSRAGRLGMMQGPTLSLAPVMRRALGESPFIRSNSRRYWRRAAGTYGVRLGGSRHGLGNGGCSKTGKPAGELFDTTARDDQQQYSDRSLRKTGRRSCRAAPGGLKPAGLVVITCTPGKWR
jgi:hypothetical protein